MTLSKKQKMEQKHEIRISPWKYDFRYVNLNDCSEKGVCYLETKQVWCTLHQHESLEDIYTTLLHESIHNALSLDVEKNDKRVMNISSLMDMEQEHELIKKLFWHINDWV